MQNRKSLTAALAVVLLTSVIWAAPKISVAHPEWSRTASIYEVNIRQYTPEGTFKAFESHLPRLEKMGVKILWLMPIHPIGEQNRKGSLGSYYSVRDYRAVNPEFGTLDDFKHLVSRAHMLGMKVIMDWVANHTAWDNVLVATHPDWYTKDSTGNFMSPVPDWHDVIDLNYDQPELRNYMIESMKFWVMDADVDGFRCDVSGMVPMDFWNRARKELDQIKPVFMLAEDENPACHEFAFDMTYGWGLMHLMNAVAKGEKNALDVAAYFQKDAKDYPADAYRMYFTSNHDENSWNGTEYDRLDGGAKAFALLTLIAPGMPLVYSGQEAGLKKQLQFFDKDSVQWNDDWMSLFYTAMLRLKRDHPALRNGVEGGEMKILSTEADSAVFAFERVKDGRVVGVMLNLSNQPQHFVRPSELSQMGFADPLSKTAWLRGKREVNLGPWGYAVYEH